MWTWALAEPRGHGKNRNMQRLMVSGLCWLHFPTRPNLSHRTETFQIKADSYHSVSSPQMRPLRGVTRLREQRARQPYLAALGISEADLSDVLWCLLADSSTNTSAGACRSLFSIETRFCSASAANGKQRGLGWPSPPERYSGYFLLIIIPIKANLAAL